MTKFDVLTRKNCVLTSHLDEKTFLQIHEVLPIVCIVQRGVCEDDVVILKRDEVAALLPALKSFVENGSFEVKE